MQEAEWLASKDPVEMLAHLGVGQWWDSVETSPRMWVRRKTKHKLDRKLQLFACACVRRVRDLIQDQEPREAIEISELFADGKATAKSLKSASVAAARYILEDEEILELGIAAYCANSAIVAAMQASSTPPNPLNVAAMPQTRRAKRNPRKPHRPICSARSSATHSGPSC